MIKALAFDAYGTLFDVRSVQGRCEEAFPGHGSDLTTLWRSMQLQYTWLRSLMGKYEDFCKSPETGWCLPANLSDCLPRRSRSSI
jgi:HAD superfamily hydrolase (TIGR01493 family)